jgi:FAD/FMN-containing dehydrogenase
MTTQPVTSALLADAPAAGLRHLCGGRVHVAGDPGYHAARGAWNVAVDQQPAAVALPGSAADVSDLVRAATAAGLRVAPQSTGHNAGPLAAQDLSDVVLVKTSAMTRVFVDAERRTARVEGGAVWLPAVEAAAEHGLAALHGSSPDVGIAGYSLGGGIGWYARKLGLATNSLTAVELVLADGTEVRADATENPDLFWALRGGGGSFGVVTALEFSLYRIATAYAGMLVWDVADAEKVLPKWAAWAADAPDEVTTSFRVLHLPPVPDIPEPLRGRSVVVIDGAVLGTDLHGRDILGDLRTLTPEIDTFDRVPASSLVRLHMDPEQPTPVVSDSAMLSALPDAAMDAFLSQVGLGARTSLLMGELRQLGGALGRPHADGGALSHLDAAFVMFAGAMAMTPEMAEQGHTDARRLTAAMAPWTTGRSYLNFAENPVDPRTAYTAAAWRRLAGIRSAVDPSGVFVANHAVPRLSENGSPTA